MRLYYVRECKVLQTMWTKGRTSSQELWSVWPSTRTRSLILRELWFQTGCRRAGSRKRNRIWYPDQLTKWRHTSSERSLQIWRLWQISSIQMRFSMLRSRKETMESADGRVLQSHLWHSLDVKTLLRHGLHWLCSKAWRLGSRSWRRAARAVSNNRWKGARAEATSG